MTDPFPFYSVDSYRVEKGIGYLAGKFSHTAARELNRRMAALGLTDAQWKPLLFLQQGGCTTAVDLSRAVGQDAGSVTRLLDRLEAKGLVQRARSAIDRRVINLELTPEGKEIARRVPEIIVDLANETLRGFSQEEFELFTNFLKRAFNNSLLISEREAS